MASYTRIGGGGENATPGGTDQDFQYNNSDEFGGTNVTDGSATFDNTTGASTFVSGLESAPVHVSSLYSGACINYRGDVADDATATIYTGLGTVTDTGYVRVGINDSYGNGSTGDPYYMKIVEIDVCFLGDTQILTSAGLKPIKDFVAGDEIISYNIKHGVSKSDKVLQVKSHNHTGEYLIVNEKVKVTPNHRLYISGVWKPIREAIIGDWLLNPDGKRVWIYSIEKVACKHTPVYSLHLNDENHNYFADGFLAHNNKCPFLYKQNTDGTLKYQCTIITGNDSKEKECEQRTPLKDWSNVYILKEIEPEVSHINTIALIATTPKGEVMLSCVNMQRIDMKQGDSLRIEFEPIPQDTTKLEIMSKGYYDWKGE